MNHSLKNYFNLFKKTLLFYNQDKAGTLAASLAYFALFSLAPSLVLIIFVLTNFYSQQEARDKLGQQLINLFGESASDFILEITSNFSLDQTLISFLILNILILIWTASSFMTQFKNVINIIWNQTENKLFKNTILNIFIEKFLDIFGLIIFGGSWILLVFANTFFTYLINFLNLNLILNLLNEILFLSITFILIFIINKFLIHQKISNRILVIGSLFSSSMILLGNSVLNIYLSYTNLDSVFGAAGSVVVLLVWIYYTIQLLLLGMEFVKALKMEFEN